MSKQKVESWEKVGIARLSKSGQSLNINIDGQWYIINVHNLKGVLGDFYSEADVQKIPESENTQ